MPDDGPTSSDDDCVVHSHQVPPEELRRYSPVRDPHSERDIANYVAGQAPDEVVEHVERVKREVVLGETYDIWDVTTHKNRWWVLTNLTNLYSQQHFPSLDYTLSFHIGLMTRLRGRSAGGQNADASPFEDVLRRLDQTTGRHDRALEAEDFQAVGMQLRECLISLADALRRRTDFDPIKEHPKASDFVGWMDVIMDHLCPGAGNKALRRHLKGTAKHAWQLVGSLTHDRNAAATASLLAVEACGTVVGNAIAILERSRIDQTEECPSCGSRQIRTHFDMAIDPDGDYYLSCAACDWSDHPSAA